MPEVAVSLGEEASVLTACGTAAVDFKVLQSVMQWRKSPGRFKIGWKLMQYS